MNPIFSLLHNNKGRGRPLMAMAGVIEIYDVIVGTDVEAKYFGGVSAEAIAKAIRAHSGPLTLKINSPGGDVFGGRVIQSAMAEHDGLVKAQVDGLAASAASFVAVAADQLIMNAGSMLMIHQGWTMAWGNKDDMLASAALLEKVDQTIAETYASKTGQSVEHYLKLMAAETWFTAAEALAEGLADQHIEEGTRRASNLWDLSHYKNPPAQEAQDSAPQDEASNENSIKRARFVEAFLRQPTA
jgi:ATP-dependent Clp protease protease subunit